MFGDLLSNILRWLRFCQDPSDFFLTPVVSFAPMLRFPRARRGAGTTVRVLTNAGLLKVVISV